MIVQVWHATNPTFGMDLRDRGRPVPVWPTNYVHVADVEAEHYAQAFELTNHIDHDWRTNDGVTVIAPGGLRSTSVGDVVVAEGEAYLCESMGWRRIDAGTSGTDGIYSTTDAAVDQIFKAQS